MDITALFFYAFVCSLLGFAGPWLGKPLNRLAIGAIVGLVAATGLPVMRALLGL